MAAALAGAALLLAVPGGADAQELDSRWLPWTGCWEVVGVGLDSEVVCVKPGEAPASVILDYVRDDIEDLVLRADGTPQQVEQAGCQGEETAAFSPDGTRVYINARYTCEGGAEQIGTGLLAMVAQDEWMEIRSFSIDGETTAWVQRYVQATPTAVEAAGAMALVTPEVILARRLAAREPTLRTISEVSFAVDSQVAAAWIVESGYRFKVNGEQLLALAEAGVAEEVLDVVVAVSNPDRFAVGPDGDLSRRAREARPGRPTSAAASFGYMPYFGRRFYNYGSWYSPWGFMYSPFGSYYDPYYYGYGYGGYRPSYIVVTPRGSEADSGGRAVAGRGYTQGRGSSVPSGSQRGWEPRRGGSSSSGGSTSGSSGGSTSSDPPVRTAKPRGGGGI